MWRKNDDGSNAILGMRTSFKKMKEADIFSQFGLILYKEQLEYGRV